MSEHKRIINFGELENIMIMLEEIISPYNIEERVLILQQVSQRIAVEVAKNKQGQFMDNAVKGLNIKGLMKKLHKEED